MTFLLVSFLKAVVSYLSWQSMHTDSSFIYSVIAGNYIGKTKQPWVSSSTSKAFVSSIRMRSFVVRE